MSFSVEFGRYLLLYICFPRSLLVKFKESDL